MKELEEEKWEIAAAAIDRSHWGMLDIEELGRRALDPYFAQQTPADQTAGIVPR